MVEFKVNDRNREDEILRFYNTTVGDDYLVNLEDTFLLAVEDNSIVGCVRLARENSFLVLRGMQIVKSHQRKRIGSNMLKRFEGLLGNEDCFCLPYSHLVPFYEQIGFSKIDITDAPDFLQERLIRYRKKSDNIIMRRPAR